MSEDEDKPPLLWVMERFIERDADAVRRFEASPYKFNTDAKVDFLSGRLQDTANILLIVLRRLAEIEER